MGQRLFNYLRLALAICIFLDGTARGAQSRLTDEQRAGQLLGTTLTGLSSDQERALWVRARSVGLLIAYRVDLQERDSIAAVAGRLAAKGLEPLIAADQEGGGVSRLEIVALPSAMALGAAGSDDLARRAGRHVGCGLRAAGITVNFAPVLDLAAPADGAGFRTRSFGGDPAAVSRLAASFVRGSIEGGVLPVGKHFPGSGFADADSHRELSKSLRSGMEMREGDLLPFAAAISAGAAGMMTAHVTFPNWTEAGALPASISPAILGILREELAFDGLVVTDAIQMRGLGDAPAGELAVRAIEAGADIVLAPAPVERDAVYGALLSAIRTGRLSEKRVERSLARIRRARARIREIGTACSSGDESLADTIARASITRIGGSAPVNFGAAFFTGGGGTIAEWFAPERRRLLPGDPPRGPEILEPLARAIACSGQWVATIETREQAEFVRILRPLLPRVPLTLVVPASPSAAAGLEAEAYVFTYGFHPATLRALRDVLEGRASALGRLPVSVDGVGGIGEGEMDYALSSGDRGSR